ncbi:hypothetical protein PMAC_000158 [Pneumocystis sp. 'macacae']|nr:hypothetical protein PMAC_000158 [Pneumocystis sp. 'macacae']
MELDELRLAALLSQRKNPLQSSTYISKESNVSKQTVENKKKDYQDTDEKEEGEISDSPVSERGSTYVNNLGKSSLKKIGYMNRMPYKKYSRVKNNTGLYSNLYQFILSQNSSNIKLEGKLAVQFLFSQGISFEYLVDLGINKEFLHKIFIDAGLSLPDTEYFQRNDDSCEKSNMCSDLKDNGKKCTKTVLKNHQEPCVANHNTKFSDSSNISDNSSKKQGQSVDSDAFLQSIRDSIDKKMQVSESIQKKVPVSHKRKYVSTTDSSDERAFVSRKKFGSKLAASVVIEFSDDENDENTDNINKDDTINNSKKILKVEDIQKDAIEKLKQKEEEIKHMMEIIAKLESSRKKKAGSVEDANYISISNTSSSDNGNLPKSNNNQEKDIFKDFDSGENKTIFYEKEQTLQEDLEKVNVQLFQKEMLVQKLKDELGEAELSFQKLLQAKFDIEVQLKDNRDVLDSIDKSKSDAGNILMKDLTGFCSISENLTTIMNSKNEISISSTNTLLSNQNNYEKVKTSNFSSSEDKIGNIEKGFDSFERAAFLSINRDEITKNLENNDVITEIKPNNNFNTLTNRYESFEVLESKKEEDSIPMNLCVNSQENVVISSQESKDIIADEKNFTTYKQYSSPLRIFHAFRFHPYFLSWVKGGFRSRTYSTRSDPNKKLCFFETAGGVCNDDSCKFLHFKDIGQTAYDLQYRNFLYIYYSLDDQLLVEMSSLLVGETEEEQQNYRVGLRAIIQALRASHFQDTTKVAQSIINYRKQFLKDESRIILF